MDSIIFELEDVGFSYLGKYPALHSIDMSVKAGEKMAVIGANGTGKSTLLQMLDGLIFPDRGSIKAFGRELSEGAFGEEAFSREFRGRVGFVFQNPDVQLFCPTVREDIAFGPLQLGVGNDEVKQRIAELADTLKIEGLLDRSPHQLSVGEKRKVAIASTLAIKSDVLVLDEPTAGLDPFTVRQIVDIIIQANLEGKTIVTATHDMHIVEEIADNLYIFGQDKRIVRSGPAKELLLDRAFLEDNNLVHIHRHSHQGTVHSHPHQHLDHHSH